MAERHCPFLNRKDERCAEHFSVGRMQHAFDHCFAQYAECPTYRELLDERNIRRDASGELVPMTIAGRPVPAASTHSATNVSEASADATNPASVAAEAKPRQPRARRPLRAA